ncbi:protease [Paenibacillus thermoaerophilus]|uniref:Protease n=1 Tax=Paenibacillus thermoaerophilus TaxID=1215385 RepID=A0ABW2V459_9BACL|nr:protease [Paenibacillus thermoaerophilus]TMV13879.1 protease [Paenibacillus thermoaerophilus]
MTEFYIGLVAFGALYAIVTVLFGDILSGAVDGALDFLSLEGPAWFQAPVLVAGLTAFGGAGWALDRLTPLNGWWTAAAALAIAAIVSAALYLGYVKPMQRTETSTAFSVGDLAGSIGEVIVPIPAGGVGEVLVTVGASRTNQIAESFEGTPLEAGARIVVVEVRDHTLRVTRFD